MIRDHVSIVKQAICSHFDISEVFENQHLWNDLDADDLTYIEIFMVLEELLDCSGFDSLEIEDYRRFTVQCMIDHVNRILNPIPILKQRKSMGLIKDEQYAWITWQKAGTHAYSNAISDPKLENYLWLANEHRHLFKFKLAIQVFHDDRDIEFLQFKDWVESLYGEKTLTLYNQSCEMISDALAKQVSDRYPGRKLKIEVSEDGENGAFTAYIPDSI